MFEVDSNPNTMTRLSLYCRLNCHGIEDELGEMYWVVQRIKCTKSIEGLEHSIPRNQIPPHRIPPEFHSPRH